MSSEIRDQLIECLNQGLKVDQISKKLGKSIGNIYLLLHRNGLSMRMGKDRAIVIYEYSQEHGIETTMEKFQISRGNCHSYRSRGRKKLSKNKVVDSQCVSDSIE